MNYAMLPPEINSGRMYSGPGSGPMLGVAHAWEQLATELYTTGQNYGSVISGLASGPWTGPAATRMSASAAPYVAWVNRTAEQAEQTGLQAKTAAAAHATAYATTVPPPVIAANRAHLAALVAGNIVGQNTPAIATTEANYEQMWAQDAAAMHRYAADSQLASRLTPFQPPRPNSDPASTVAQSAAAGQGVTTSVVDTVSQGAQSLVTGAQNIWSGTGIADFGNLYNLAILGSILAGNGMGLIGLLGVSGAAKTDDTVEAGDTDGSVPEILVGGPEAMMRDAASSAASEARLVQGAVTAGAGQADSLSGLSVPRAWTSAAPEMRLAAGDQPTPHFVAPKGTGSIFGEMPLFGGAPLMGLPGRGGSGAQGRREPDDAKRKTKDK